MQSEHMVAERMRSSFTLQGRCAEEYHWALTRLMTIHPSGLLSAGISPHLTSLSRWTAPDTKPSELYVTMMAGTTPHPPNVTPTPQSKGP